jgi:glucan biosynthesis protein C
VVPFAAGWLLLYPAVLGGFAFAAGGLDAVSSAVRAGSLFYGNNTMHLWFLYDLLYFYLAAVVIAAGVDRLPPRLREIANAGFAAVVSRAWLRPLPLAAITAVTLIPMGGGLRTSTSFVPDLEVLLAYGVFFGFGWMLYAQRSLLNGFGDFAWTQVVLGTALLPLNQWAFEQLVGAGTDGALNVMLLRAASGALMVWLLFFGITGLFLRYLDQPSAIVRYVVDSSYWVYLVHLPLTIWLPGLIGELEWSPWVKMFAVLAGTAAFGFATYDLFVRPSFIGAVLNGRRYPRGFPYLEPHPG